MDTNQTQFDIFDYLGIEISDDPEKLRKAIDALTVGSEKYKKLYSNPEFSKIRNKIYTKNTSAYLAYVQEIRNMRNQRQQELIRQQQERQRQEQIRQEQIRQQQERQRQEQIRQQQIRQQQERQRQEQIRQQQQYQQQQYQQQQYRQQQYRQPQPQYQQPYYPPQPRYQPRANTQQSAQHQTRVRNSNQQTNPAAAILAFIGAVLYGIWWAIKNAFISICAFFGFGDAPATTQLATPVIASIVEHDLYVDVVWGPVFCADYYVLHDEDGRYDDEVIDSGLKTTIYRQDYGTKTYTLTAHSNKQKYSTSNKATITVRPKYLGSPQNNQEDTYDTYNFYY
ncbi:MAG: hypothetical protein IJF84_10565 [Thermoguttaceae bacterium]|nr:hypothetical protein [Thermoguttaceae bacterium]